MRASPPKTSCRNGELQQLHFLTDTKSRLEILECLSNANRTQSSLKESLDIPNTTLYRNLEKLEERDLISRSKTDPVIEITVYGESILRILTRITKELQATHMMERFCSKVPSIPNSPFPCPETLGSHEIISNSESNPHKAESIVNRALMEMDSCSCLLPSIAPIYTKTLLDREQCSEIKMITSCKSVQNLKKSHQKFYDMCDEYTVMEAAELPRIGIFLYREGIIIEAYNEYQNTNSILLADRGEHEIERWAKTTLDIVENIARPVIIS